MIAIALVGLLAFVAGEVVAWAIMRDDMRAIEDDNAWLRGALADTEHKYDQARERIHSLEAAERMSRGSLDGCA